jgi:hypothetical protein
MHTPRRTLVVITAALALTLLAACGSDKKTASSGSSSSSSSSSAATTTGAPFDEAAAKAQITKAYETFFNGNEGDKATKLQQLAEPDKLKALYEENFTKNAAVAAMTTVEVKTVTFGADNTTADVTYTLLVNGTPALENFGGSAVLKGGYWRITTAAFCDITYIGATQPAECTS